MKSLLKVVPIASLVLTGCLDSDDSSTSNSFGECDSNNPNLVVQTSQWDDGAYASAVAIGCSRDASLVDNYLEQANASDYRISTAEDGFYHIGRDGISTISKHNYENPNVFTLDYSTNDPQSGNSNPYAVIQASNEKAYILRYGMSDVWVINPEAQDASDFKTNTIDLGAYVYSGSIDVEATNMAVGKVIGDKLYIGVQHLFNGVSYNYDDPSDIVVIDITTDTEIDTTPNDTNDEKSIQLAGANISALSSFGNKLYSASRGDYGTQYGYLEVINADSYEVSTLIQGSADIGHIVDVAMVSESLGYFVASPSWGTATLYSFNPSAAETWTEIEGFSGINITDIETDLDGYLWIGTKGGSNENHGVHKFDPSGAEETQFLATTYPPVQIAFKPN